MDSADHRQRTLSWTRALQPDFSPQVILIPWAATEHLHIAHHVFENYSVFEISHFTRALYDDAFHTFDHAISSVTKRDHFTREFETTIPALFVEGCRDFGP